MKTAIAFLLLQEILGNPVGPHAHEDFNYYQWDGRGTVPKSHGHSHKGKLRIDYSSYKLTVPASCAVDDLDAQPSVVFYEDISERGQTFVAPVGHHLKWHCMAREKKSGSSHK